MHVDSRVAALALIVLTSFGALAQQDDPPLPVEVAHLAGSLYQLRCNGEVNVVASVGDDGTLLVDSGYGQTAQALQREVERLGHGPARIIINTHGDGDHVGGNAVLGKDAVIIARPEVRRQMGTFYALPAVEVDGLPTVSVEGETTIFFNDEAIRIFPAAGAHTAGDSVVFFTKSGVAHVGDLVLLGTFPDAAPGRGGDARRLVEVLEQLEATLPENTTLVAAHGGLFSMDDLAAYIDMVKSTMAAVEVEMAEGRTLAEIVEINPLAPWHDWEDAGNGLSFEDWTTQIFIALGGSAKQSICQPVTEVLVRDGAAAAAERYRELKRTEPERWNFAENELNGLGYQLLARGRIEDAIVVLELNVEAFPEAFNTYDSLGEALMLAGRTGDAVVNYERSLDLNPENTNATAMLARLKK